MRYGIISDIHSNLEALTAVLESCRQNGVRRYFCVGDIVGYGANPKECLSVIHQIKAAVVAGNHDWAVAGRIDASYFNSAGKQAVLWNQTQISLEDINYLQNLELVYKNDEMICVHGTLHKPEVFYYLKDTSQAPDSFYLMDRNITFVGHTHVPRIFINSGDNIYYYNEMEVDLEEKNKYIVNVGSVGQPRDGNPMASYCIFDPDLNRVQIKRVPYDIKTAQAKILEVGLPEILAQRLAIGQ